MTDQFGNVRNFGSGPPDDDGLPGYVDAEGVVLEGIHCPECGKAMNVRLTAASYPVPGGQYRKRYCDCGAEVITVETTLKRSQLEGAYIIQFPKNRRGGPGGRSGMGQPTTIIAQLVRALGGKVTDPVQVRARGAPVEVGIVRVIDSWPRCLCPRCLRLDKRHPDEGVQLSFWRYAPVEKPIRRGDLHVLRRS